MIVKLPPPHVLAQQAQDKNKIYSLHEPSVYVPVKRVLKRIMANGKDHKKYEYGAKASIVATKTKGIIVGVSNYETNPHDSKTLEAALSHAKKNRSKPTLMAVCDRGYRGLSKAGDTEIIIPKKPLKRDNRYQRDKKRKLCKRRSAIEPLLGHLKSDFRLSRNFLKGVVGDEINLFMVACA